MHTHLKCQFAREKNRPDTYVERVQVRPNLSFGGNSLAAMVTLTNPEQPGPMWRSLDEQTSVLDNSEQELVTGLTATYAMHETHASTPVDAKDRWKEFPVKLYPFIGQNTSAWLALRRYHAITASVAFDLLLCGTGPSRQQYGRIQRALKMPRYRKSAPFALALNIYVLLMEQPGFLLPAVIS